ncbi:unnamed protein product [Urochloa decumbens]|uniref:No apical meristem-associated C-terminal domain-containing protein n=1 Tax=Urochloa decumbens TaxID=240449 RepID=A0ABC8YVX8_9POAL
MVFSDDDLIAQWWEEEDDSDDSDDSDNDDDYDHYIIAAAILGMEHERTKAKHRGSVSGRQVVMREMPSGTLRTVTNKRPRTDNSTPSREKVGEGEEDDSSKSQTPDSSQPSQKTRPVRRKQAKEKMKSGGEAGPYMEELQELLVVKDREKERKLKEERWEVIKSLEEQKLELEKHKLMWEKEHWIMFCDVSTMEPEKKAKVLAMRAQIASQKMALLKSSDGASSVFGGGRGGHHGGSSSFHDGSGGDANGGDL